MKLNPLQLLYRRVDQLFDEDDFIRSVFDLFHRRGFEIEEIRFILGKEDSEVENAVSQLADLVGSRETWLPFLREQRNLEARTLRPKPFRKTRLPEILRGESIFSRLTSPFEEFLKSLKIEPALAAKTIDVDPLREHYNENLINLTLAQVHVTIETDNDHIILCFIGEANLNGVQVIISRLDNEQSTACKIEGNDVRFALSALGLTIGELNQDAFRLKIRNQQVEGRL